MKKLFTLASMLILIGCGGPVPREQEASEARAKLDRLEAERREEEIIQKRDWYSFIQNDTNVICINRQQYLVWYNSTSTTGNSRSMVPLGYGGAPLTCSGGIEKAL